MTFVFDNTGKPKHDRETCEYYLGQSTTEAQRAEWGRAVAWHDAHPGEPLETDQAAGQPGEPAGPLFSLPNPTTAERILDERRISERTRLTFGLTFGKNSHGYPAILYPTPGAGLRAKNLSGKAKYIWEHKTPECLFYHGPDLADAVANTGGALWLASGEADVWAFHSAGIEHVMSAGYSEGKIPAELVDRCHALGAVQVYAAPDLDDAGGRWGEKLAALFQNSGIDFDLRELPAELGEHGDVGRAWQGYTKALPFERYLLGLPKIRVELEPEPDQEPAKSGQYEPGDQVAAGFRAYVAGEIWGAVEFGPDGNSNNVPCIFHDDRQPSATLHDEYGLYCHVCGQFWNWSELAAAAGLQTYADWLRDNPDDAYIFGLSTETREALIRQKMTNEARILDALYLAGVRPGDALTISDASDLTGISYHTIYRVLRSTIPAAAEPVFSDDRELFAKRTPILFSACKGAQNANNSRRGPKAGFYTICGPREAAEFAGVGHFYQHFHDAITREICQSAKLYRAEVYGAFPRRNPGTYSRAFLAGSRLGMSKATARKYDPLANLEVQERIERTPFAAEDAKQLPAEKAERGGIWLETADGNRYPATQKGAKRAFTHAPDMKVWRCEQKMNHYGPGPV